MPHLDTFLPLYCTDVILDLGTIQKMWSNVTFEKIMWTHYRQMSVGLLVHSSILLPLDKLTFKSINQNFIKKCAMQMWSETQRSLLFVNSIKLDTLFFVIVLLHLPFMYHTINCCIFILLCYCYIQFHL